MRPHLYKRPCPSVRRLVRRSVHNAFVKIDDKWTFRDAKVLDEEKRDEEEGGMRRKEGRGEWKNEKVVKRNEKSKSRERTHYWPRWALFIDLRGKISQLRCNPFQMIHTYFTILPSVSRIANAFVVITLIFTLSMDAFRCFAFVNIWVGQTRPKGFMMTRVV